MKWEDEGFLLYKNKYSENSLIAEFFTLNHGKCSGIIYGGTSRKIKNYLQLGNKIHLILNSKNESKIGYFKIEIIEAISPAFFNNNNKINCLISSLNFLRTVLPESQLHKNIYNLFSSFLNDLKYNDQWIFDYIFFEMNLLKEIGFDMNLKPSQQSIISTNNSLTSVKVDNQEIKVPSFLVNKKISDTDNKHIHLALKTLSNFIEKNILIPNNINISKFRKNLENFYR